MPALNRRTFLKSTFVAGAIGLAAGAAPATPSPGTPKPKRLFTRCLACGPIGVPDDPKKAIARATQHGFEAIEPNAGFLAKLSDAELQDYRAAMQAAKLAWGSAGLPVQFRDTDDAFASGLRTLPDTARALQRAGVTRMATWLSPGHNALTYLANFRQHARRLREVAKILGDHGLRLGLEYVGPKTSWSRSRYPFIHTMAEMKDLLAEIQRDNVGFLLDSWHWYTAGETAADLRTLQNRDIVLVHLNDAPKDIPVEQQMDSRRDLPCATGVIDLRAFLGALVEIGYDGPTVCEPFSQTLRGLQPDAALATVAAAMKQACALVD